MLGRTLCLSSNLSRVVNRRVNFSYTRLFSVSSDGSHNDFSPQRKVVSESLDEVQQLIKSQVTENPIMLYMKGNPQQPMCGFSLQAVRILNALGTDFASVNVLEYPSIREGIKVYSEWPTLPQLYINGEFIGGCDIMTQMYNDGSLETLLKDKKLIE